MSMMSFISLYYGLIVTVLMPLWMDYDYILSFFFLIIISNFPRKIKKNAIICNAIQDTIQFNPSKQFAIGFDFHNNGGQIFDLIEHKQVDPLLDITTWIRGNTRSHSCSQSCFIHKLPLPPWLHLQTFHNSYLLLHSNPPSLPVHATKTSTNGNLWCPYLEICDIISELHLSSKFMSLHYHRSSLPCPSCIGTLWQTINCFFALLQIT